MTCFAKAEKRAIEDIAGCLTSLLSNRMYYQVCVMEHRDNDMTTGDNRQTPHSYRAEKSPAAAISRQGIIGNLLGLGWLGKLAGEMMIHTICWETHKI